MRITLGLLTLAIPSMAGYLGPTPYLTAADSPFVGTAFQYFYLDTFERGAPSVPGVTIGPGTSVISPGPSSDSVDGDDGTVDGLGTAGHSLYSTAAAVRFTFSAAALGGHLPTHAGIVWTDVGFNAGILGVAPVSFEAFDASGAPLGVLGPFTFGDGSVAGGTAEDRFFGVTHTGGVSAIELRVPSSNDWEMDHLQFGYASAVPEPATGFLVAAGLGATLAVRRRRRVRR